jgi:excisionase family DNA binding protein
MRKSATNDDVLSTREAAERLGVALRTVQLWVESGVLPAWKTAGGHRRISRVAVEKLIEERRSALAGDPLKATGDATKGQPLKLMLVEDEPEQRKLLAMVVDRWDLPIELSTAADGFEALLRIGESCPDVLVTDLNMPGMDGFRMVAALRALGRDYAAMDIVVITALSRDEITARGGLPDGVRLYFKPVPIDDLEQVVRGRLAPPHGPDGSGSRPPAPPPN